MDHCGGGGGTKGMLPPSQIIGEGGLPSRSPSSYAYDISDLSLNWNSVGTHSYYGCLSQEYS